MNQLLSPFLIVLAAIYFVADAVFVAVAHPIAAWLADRKIFPV